MLDSHSHSWEIGPYVVEVSSAYSTRSGALELPLIVYSRHDGLIVLDTTLCARPKKDGSWVAFCQPVLFELTGEVKSP